MLCDEGTAHLDRREIRVGVVHEVAGVTRRMVGNGHLPALLRPQLANNDVVHCCRYLANARYKVVLNQP